MRIERLEEILRRIAELRILVVGDFFLDQYWVVDASLEEVSLETELAAHQITQVRSSPGAAGTVANNLATLGVGRIEALGVIGNDGSGFELQRGLEDRGVTTQSLLVTDSRRTPVYTKCLTADTQEERQRFDVKNREPLPERLEEALLRKVKKALEKASGVAILDQVQEENCGVITDRTREELAQLAKTHLDKVFLADSRTRILEFRNVMIKPNRFEAAEALGRAESDVEGLLHELGARTGRPVLLTSGEEGIWLLEGGQLRNFPALPISGPIDIVGAGDSVSASVVSGLSAGASLSEAAQLANLVASITVQKLGTTGTASPEEILSAASSHRGLIESW